MYINQKYKYHRSTFCVNGRKFLSLIPKLFDCRTCRIIKCFEWSLFRGKYSSVILIWFIGTLIVINSCALPPNSGMSSISLDDYMAEQVNNFKQASLQVQTGLLEDCWCTRILKECFRAWNPPCSPQTHLLPSYPFMRLIASILQSATRVCSSVICFLIGWEEPIFWMLRMLSCERELL